MHALTPDDLLPLHEYAPRRREFFETQCRYLDRYRRVRVGPRVTLLFQNRQTLWFQVQEVLRVARLADPARVRQELEVYNRLLPGPGCLQAALMIDADERRLVEELAPFRELKGADVCLVAGPTVCAAELLTSRPEDRCMGASHWVRFVLDAPARVHLANFRLPAWCELRLPAYGHAGPPLSDEVRQSLLDDLTLSDRAV